MTIDEQLNQLIKNYAKFHNISEERSREIINWIGHTESLRSLGVHIRGVNERD